MISWGGVSGQGLENNTLGGEVLLAERRHPGSDARHLNWRQSLQASISNPEGSFRLAAVVRLACFHGLQRPLDVIQALLPQRTFECRSRLRQLPELGAGFPTARLLSG